MGKIDIKFRSDCRQRSVCGVKQRICGEIIRRSEPFALEYAPQCFGDVQMRTIRREKEQEQSTFFPYRSKFPEQFSAVDACVVKNKKCILFDAERKSVKEIGNLIGCDAVSGGKTVIAIIAVYHAEDVEALSSLRRYEDILTAELPAVRHVSLSADVTLISKIKVYESGFCLIFEFLQLLGLIRIERWRRFSLWTFSYTSISRANADKKALNVLSLASFPEACCHDTFAFLTLCLSCPITLRTASSSEQSIIGLRPRPGRISKPLMPSVSKRFIQELTEICVISVCNPTSFDVSPWAFKRIARQRIRYAWLLPLRKPSSNCRPVCLSVV